LWYRAAAVVLTARRTLVFVVRETPFREIYLENLLKLFRLGAVIFPPVPAFYTHPQTVDDIVGQTVMRVLDQFDLHFQSESRWSGEMSVTGSPADESMQD